jgi:hypothetical protein
MKETWNLSGGTFIGLERTGLMRYDSVFHTHEVLAVAK